MLVCVERGKQEFPEKYLLFVVYRLQNSSAVVSRRWVHNSGSPNYTNQAKIEEINVLILSFKVGVKNNQLILGNQLKNRLI